MSKYTTEVRFICESVSGLDNSVGANDVNSVLNNSWDKIFNFNFPIFDEAYREILCKKILMHYYTREIGFETVGLWKLKLNTKLNEIMPYYNQLYKSELLEFNPLYDTDITRKKDVTNDNTINGNSNTNITGKQTDKFSNIPNGALTGVESGEYLTTARIIDENSNNTTTSTTKGNNIEDYLEKVSGKTGSHTYSDMLQEFRKTFLNIDMQIIDELSDLFFKLW